MPTTETLTMRNERGQFIQGHPTYTQDKHLSLKTRLKISAALIGRKPSYGFLGKHHSNASKKLISVHSGMKRPEVAAKSSRVHKGKKMPLETRIKISKTLTGFKRSKDTCLRMSQSRKLLFQNTNLLHRIMSNQHIRPTKPERVLKNLLEHILPYQYKYVGHGEFIIGGKCPDFLNCDGQKKLVELYGTYWHRDDNPQERIDYFKRYGFDTLIVWENELKNVEKLSDKLIHFNLR